MRIVAFITKLTVVRRILAHLERGGIDVRAGPWADAAGRSARTRASGERMAKAARAGVTCGLRA